MRELLGFFGNLMLACIAYEEISCNHWEIGIAEITYHALECCGMTLVVFLSKKGLETRTMVLNTSRATAIPRVNSLWTIVAYSCILVTLSGCL